MKSITIIFAIILCAGAISCSSERRDNAMDDTSIMDTSMNDSIDTTGVADTAGVDTMYRNSPAKSGK